MEAAILEKGIITPFCIIGGPEGPQCHVEAAIAASKNRAMISYRSEGVATYSIERGYEIFETCNR